MRTNVAILVCGVALAMTSTGCKKGGGGGGWLVGTEGMMVNVQGDTLSSYELGASERLEAIACRYAGEAWVAGAHGTLLYTSDGGDTWDAETLPTIADLHAVATQDAGRVFVAGDGVLFTSVPDFATGVAEWTQLADGVTSFRSVAAAQRGTTVLADSADGGVWSYTGGQLVRVTTIAGARAVAVSPDGKTALVAGAGLTRSTDGGATWTPVAVDAGLAFEDASIEDSGAALAVGAGGAVTRVEASGSVVTQHLGTADLHTMHVEPGSTNELGYAAGDGGQIWVTRDAGRTWTAGPTVEHTVLGVDEIGDGHR